MNFSSNQYQLTSNYPVAETEERLYANTLITKKLMRVRTDKPFIGEVDDEGFYLMGSSRMGVLCTITGRFEADGQHTLIKLTTKIHRAFIILFTCWAAVIITMLVISYITAQKNAQTSLAELPVLLVLIAGARYLLHLAYKGARNMALKQIEEIIT